MVWLNLINSVIAGIYSFVNAVLLTSLFAVMSPHAQYGVLFMKLFLKSILSLILVFSFYALIAYMFCWTAAISNCIECICPVFMSSSLVDYMHLPAAILFYVTVSLVQATIIAIPQGLSPTTFVGLIAASNLIASLLKLGAVSLFA